MTAREEAVFEEIWDYILNRQNMVTQYIAAHPILELYEKTVRRPVAWVGRRWLEYEEIELAGERARAAAASDEEEERGGEET